MIKKDVRRLLLYLDSIGMPVNRLESLCGFSRRYLANMNYQIPMQRVDTILKILPDLNKEWLLSGEGEMNNGIPTTAKQTILEKRETILDRVEAVINAGGYSIKEYESINHLVPGTFNNAKKRGDEKVIRGWVNAVAAEFPEYSWDWMMTGNGYKEVSRRYFIPIISETKLIEASQDTELSVDLFSVSEDSYCLAEKGDLDFGLRIIRDIASPSITSGDILLCQLIKHEDFEWTPRDIYLLYDSSIKIRRAETTRQLITFVSLTGNEMESFDLANFKPKLIAKVCGISRWF